MSGAAKAWGPERMCGHYRIDMGIWAALQNMWNPSTAQNAHFPAMVDQEAARLQMGGQPRIVNALSYQDIERGAAQVGDALGNLFGGVAKAIAPPGVGTRVMVQWSDGQKYPGTVAQVAPGQYLVTMGNGQQHWIAAGYVTLP
jgi:hypothetical protein